MSRNGRLKNGPKIGMPRRALESAAMFTTPESKPEATSNAGGFLRGARLGFRNLAVRWHGADGVGQDLRELFGQFLGGHAGLRGEFADGLLAESVMDLGGRHGRVRAFRHPGIHGWTETVAAQLI